MPGIFPESGVPANQTTNADLTVPDGVLEGCDPKFYAITCAGAQFDPLAHNALISEFYGLLNGLCPDYQYDCTRVDNLARALEQCCAGDSNTCEDILAGVDFEIKTENFRFSLPLSGSTSNALQTVQTDWGIPNATLHPTADTITLGFDGMDQALSGLAPSGEPTLSQAVQTNQGGPQFNVVTTTTFTCEYTQTVTSQIPINQAEMWVTTGAFYTKCDVLPNTLVTFRLRKVSGGTSEAKLYLYPGNSFGPVSTANYATYLAHAAGVSSPDTAESTTIQTFPGQRIGFVAFAFSPSGAGGAAIEYSTDGGLNWVQFTTQSDIMASIFALNSN